MLQSQGKLPPMSTKRKSEDGNGSNEASRDGHDAASRDISGTSEKPKKKKKKRKKSESSEAQSESDFSE